MGSQWVGHNWATFTVTVICCVKEVTFGPHSRMAAGFQENQLPKWKVWKTASLVDTWRFGESDMHRDSVEALSPFPVKESQICHPKYFPLAWELFWGKSKKTLKTQEKFYLFLACVLSSVMSDSLRPQRPTRLLCPQDFPGKNIGVGCHFLLQGILPTHGPNLPLLHLLHWQVTSLPTVLCYAKSLQSCPTLCDPIDSSPPGSPIPGIFQARTLEWVAISFSNAWKWKVKVKSLTRVWLLATPWTAAYQAPPSMGFSRQEYWSGVPLPSPTNCATLS